MFAALVKGILLGLTLAISVGPVIFSIIRQSLNNGHRGGLTFVFGVSASDITLVVLSQLFTELFRSLLDFKKEIGIGGSCLLIGLGLFNLFLKRDKGVQTNFSSQIAMRKRDYLKTFFAGYFMNTLNPAVIGFWLVIATSVVSYSFYYRVTMFATCLGFVLSTDIAKVFLAGKLRKKLTPHNIHIINKISGLILIGFGIALIWGTLEFASSLHH